jgi:hypothetical protein
MSAMSEKVLFTPCVMIGTACMTGDDFLQFFRALRSYGRCLVFAVFEQAIRIQYQY